MGKSISLHRPHSLSIFSLPPLSNHNNRNITIPPRPPLRREPIYVLSKPGRDRRVVRCGKRKVGQAHVDDEGGKTRTAECCGERGGFETLDGVAIEHVQPYVHAEVKVTNFDRHQAILCRRMIRLAPEGPRKKRKNRRGCISLSHSDLHFNSEPHLKRRGEKHIIVVFPVRLGREKVGEDESHACFLRAHPRKIYDIRRVALEVSNTSLGGPWFCK